MNRRIMQRLKLKLKYSEIKNTVSKYKLIKSQTQNNEQKTLNSKYNV